MQRDFRSLYSRVDSQKTRDSKTMLQLLALERYLNLNSLAAMPFSFVHFCGGGGDRLRDLIELGFSWTKHLLRFPAREGKSKPRKVDRETIGDDISSISCFANWMGLRAPQGHQPAHPFLSLDRGTCSLNVRVPVIVPYPCLLSVPCFQNKT